MLFLADCNNQSINCRLQLVGTLSYIALSRGYAHFHPGVAMQLHTRNSAQGLSTFKIYHFEHILKNGNYQLVGLPAKNRPINS